MALVLKSISMNTNGDAALGSLHCRQNSRVPIDPVARPGSGGAIAPVWVLVPRQISAQLQLEVEIENTGNTPVNVMLSARETSRLPVFGNVAFTGVTVPAYGSVLLRAGVNAVHVVAYARQTMVLQQKWQWAYTTAGGMIEYDLCETTQRVYLLHALPLPPWDIALQPYSPGAANYIWTDLLDVCCAACDAYSAAVGTRPATDAEHMTALTTAHNADPAFHYDTRRGESFYTLFYGAARTVKLQKYLNDHNSAYYSYLNCSDCATIVQTLGLACGVAASSVQITPVNPALPGFATNPVVSIGYTDWEVPFGTGFSYHEMASLATATPPDEHTVIYDACLMVDNSAYPSAPGPAYLKVPALPCGTPFAETAAPIVNVPPAAPYGNDFYRERLVADGADCFIVPGWFTVNQISPTLALQSPIPLDTERLDPLMRRFGLAENPLPHSDGSLNWEDARLHFPPLADARLLEDYGRHRVYEAQWEGAVYQVALTYTFNEAEAFAAVLNTLSGIAHPGLRRGGENGLVYEIEGELRLFVSGGVVVKVSSVSAPDSAGLNALAARLGRTM